MRRTVGVIAIVLVAAVWAAPAQAQAVVKRLQTEGGRIASGVWVNDTFYLSGQLPTPVTPADAAKGTAAVYGSMQAQSENVFMKIQNALKEQGLGMGDVVSMRVFLAPDTAGKFDSAGMNAAYSKFFGTPEQANKPARATVGVAALVAAGALVEIEVIAARSK